MYNWRLGPPGGDMMGYHFLPFEHEQLYLLTPA